MKGGSHECEILKSFFLLFGEKPTFYICHSPKLCLKHTRQVYFIRQSFFIRNHSLTVGVNIKKYHKVECNP